MNLALPSSCLPLVYRNELQHLITALPYVDGEMTMLEKQTVRLMIDEEMRKMDKIDYLADLPMPVTRSSDLLKAEMKRIQDGIPMQKQDFKQHAEDLDLGAQYQYQQINLINQELLHKYGKDSWTALLNQQEKEKTRLQQQQTLAKESINETNAQRKFEQTEVKYKLDSITGKIRELLHNNQILEVECLNLEHEVEDQIKKKMKLY